MYPVWNPLPILMLPCPFQGALEFWGSVWMPAQNTSKLINSPLCMLRQSTMCWWDCLYLAFTFFKERQAWTFCILLRTANVVSQIDKLLNKSYIQFHCYDWWRERNTKHSVASFSSSSEALQAFFNLDVVKKCVIASQPVMAWKKGRTLARSGPRDKAFHGLVHTLKGIQS